MFNKCENNINEMNIFWFSILLKNYKFFKFCIGESGVMDIFLCRW